LTFFSGSQTTTGCRHRKKRLSDLYDKKNVFVDYRQQQQIERVKKWLQLRNRDTDHRSQVEERRRKREEETKVFFF
jgi:hypothetical protein